MKIGIYHPFQNLADNYSLSHVCVEQLLMLVEHNIEAHFFTSTGFNAKVPEGVIVHNILPYNGAKGIYNVVKPIIKDMDAVFTHDIRISQSFTDHLIALRDIADETDIKWIHWIHSAPDQFVVKGEQKKHFVNSIYVSMNKTDIPRLAKAMNVSEGYCRAIYNSVTPDQFFDFHPFTRQIIKKHKLYDCDVLITYPLDTGRFKSKGGFKVIKLVEKLRKNGADAKVVFVNAAANDPKRKKTIQNIHKGKEEYIIFTSLEGNTTYIVDEHDTVKFNYESPYQKQYDEDVKNGVVRTTTSVTFQHPITNDMIDNVKLGYRFEVFVPRRVVRELFQISNLFPLLSDSEGCSLTLLEATLAKNLIVLNADFPPLLEFGGHITGTHGNILQESDNVLYMKVSSVRQTTNYNPSDDNYYDDWSRFILERLGQDRSLRFNRLVINRFNRDFIWVNMIEPLIK